MSKKTFFVVFIVLPLIVYGGVKAYLHHHITQGVDAAVAGLAPYVKVKYGEITTTWKGDARIERVDVTVPQTNETIRVAAFELQAGNLYRLLTLRKTLEQSEIPEGLGFAILGVDLNLHSDYAVLFDEFVEKALKEAPEFLAHLPDLSCGDVKIFTLDHYLAMGYDNQITDLHFSYSQETKGQLVLITTVSIKDMFAFDSKEVLTTGTSVNSFADLATFKPRLVSLSGNYTDNSYTQRAVKLCTERNGGNAQEAREGQLRDFLFNLTQFSLSLNELKLEPNEIMLAQYKPFAEKPGTLTFTAEPREPLDISTLQFYKPSDVPALLNLNLQAK